MALKNRSRRKDLIALAEVFIERLQEAGCYIPRDVCEVIGLKKTDKNKDFIDSYVIELKSDLPKFIKRQWKAALEIEEEL